MDFATPIMLMLSLIFFLCYSVLAIVIGFIDFIKKSEITETFYGFVEITCGFLMITSLGTMETQMKLTILLIMGLMMLCIFRILEAFIERRKIKVLPLLVLTIGFPMLRTLMYLNYLFTEYEANW